jgi:hypothetical protein
MMIFHDKCNAVELNYNAYMQAVSIMLEEWASKHYYIIHMCESIFDQFCNNIKTYFEEHEW